MIPFHTRTDAYRSARDWKAWRTVVLRARTNDPDEVNLWIMHARDGLTVNHRHRPGAHRRTALHRPPTPTPHHGSPVRHLTAHPDPRPITDPETPGPAPHPAGSPGSSLP
ncbi:hypothetical protein OG601_31650 [Streptomyces sp. NBC_01239]|uniref:hypothetical protein n=1 Tax=Streptomyces sp. NBC_01239 TaxID=2903792 RepID=UPI0022503AE7|nr:hypothetical protein [Streptomyces sp. NBC_01239]MCX4815163.1 hypothetical protein [Streptomyces sp. NBC_01239]